MSHPIPVVCDRCRAEGLAGEGDFAGLAGLLDFEPVPLQVERVDGWSPECQRAFIAALSVLGSSDRAAKAVGKSATGAERLRKLPGSEGFRAAWERAKAISYERGTFRLANSLRTATAEAGPAAVPAHEAPVADEAEEARNEKRVLELIGKFFDHYTMRIGMERTARLQGRIVEADFYVHQITWLEIGIELLSGGQDEAWRMLSRFRTERGDMLLQVAETPLSRMLDEARRAQWAEAGEPGRPPRRRDEDMVDKGTHKCLGATTIRLDGTADYKELCRRQDEGYAAAAKAQVEWEAQARREYEERRARDASS